MIYLILAMLLYSVAILFSAAASRHANTNLVAAIINTASAFIPVALVIPLIAKKNFQGQKFGIAMALVAGALIALFVMSINKAYAQNKVGIVTPVVFGGAIFLSTVISLFVFKEKTSTLQTLGLLFMGVGLVAIVYARAAAK